MTLRVSAQTRWSTVAYPANRVFGVQVGSCDMPHNCGGVLMIRPYSDSSTAEWEVVHLSRLGALELVDVLREYLHASALGGLAVTALDEGSWWARRRARRASRRNARRAAEFTAEDTAW